MTPAQNKDTSRSRFFLSGLGVAKLENKAVLFYSTKKNYPFNIALSDKNGLNFRPINDKLSFPPRWPWFNKKPKIKDFRVSRIKNKYLLTFLEKDKDRYYLKYRQSPDLIKWSEDEKVDSIHEAGMLIPFPKKEKRLIFGRKKIDLGYFKKLTRQPQKRKTIFQPKEKILGQTNLKICQIFNHQQGILILLYRYQDPDIWEDYSWQLLLVDKDNPQQIIWSKQIPISASIPTTTETKINPLGAVKLKNKLISYWQIGSENIYALTQPFFEIRDSTGPSPFPYLEKLKRHKKNPILEPKPENKWESKLVFNPAAVNIDDKIHLIYRAVGENDISVFGYANTKSGFEIDYRSNKPAYIPREKFEINRQAPKATYHYTSGWGCGGCEDPKLTKIKDTIYMTYTAWNGVEPPGVALTSIKVNDFKNQNWNWSEPTRLSPKGEIHKNWALFPDKINGKYAVLHSLSPKILVDYFDDLNFDKNGPIKSYYSPSGRKNHWDNWMRGVGPTPIKTNDGWLIFYHAMDNHDPGRYKVGAMILESNDPTKIKYRTNYPLLEPDMDYENVGFKSGVVYACGAAVKDKKLLVYYGGADTVSCVAYTKIESLVSSLKKQNSRCLNQWNTIN